METLVLTPLPTVFAALAADASWWEKIGYQVNGLAVVFIALGLIWGVMEFIGWMFRLAARRPVAVPGTAIADSVALTDEIPPETIAAIAAAVSATVGTGHVIHAIAPVAHDPAWAREGRREVFQSHKIR